MDSIALLIIHPERIVRESLSTVLTQYGEFTVLETNDGNDSAAIIERICAQRADVMILDITLARRYGPQVIAKMRTYAPDTRVLVTGVPDRDGDIIAMIESGATGYATQDASLLDLISTIRAVMLGQTLCSPRVASVLFSRLASPVQVLTGMAARREEPRLTRRQLQILALIDIGLTNKEIARRLSLEIQTVKNHIHNILDKLQVRGRVEAARNAKVAGLLVAIPVHTVEYRPHRHRAPPADAPPSNCPGAPLLPSDTPSRDQMIPHVPDAHVAHPL